MTQTTDHRFGSLDGLRGIAALIVVFYHLSMVLPSMAVADAAAGQSAATFSLTWWATYTPLKLFTAGPEVVVVFFVLSGFVLSLAPLTRPGFDWLSYVPRRIVRLYLPTIVALLLAAAILTWVPQPYPSTDNGWIQLGYHPLVTPQVLIDDATILFGAPFTLNGPMWSLVPEVLFSLLLPVFVAIIVWFRRLWWVVMIVSIVEYSGQNYFYPDYLGYLATFMIGVAFAAGWSDLQRFAAFLNSREHHRARWGALAVLGVLLVPFDRVLRAVLPTSNLEGALGLFCSSVGAAVLVFLALTWGRAIWALTLRPVRWLGRVSFSLYLVHLPLILAVTFLVGEQHFPVIVIAALPLCLVVAQLFYTLVEKPTIALSRSVGHRMHRRLAALDEPLHHVK